MCISVHKTSSSESDESTERATVSSSTDSETTEYIGKIFFFPYTQFQDVLNINKIITCLLLWN